MSMHDTVQGPKNKIKETKWQKTTKAPPNLARTYSVLIIKARVHALEKY
jgi:hypothetical protein